MLTSSVIDVDSPLLFALYVILSTEWISLVLTIKIGVAAQDDFGKDAIAAIVKVGNSKT